jgi:predicted  nucleic acid-binding Zn-ribbon protein
MLNIIKYKGCKRCGGDLFLERDSEGLYVSCLQCGAVYLRRVTREVPLPEPKRRKVYAR